MCDRQPDSCPISNVRNTDMRLDDLVFTFIHSKISEFHYLIKICYEFAAKKQVLSSSNLLERTFERTQKIYLLAKKLM